MRLFRFNMISYLSIVLILVVAPGDIQAVEPPANPNVIVMVSDNQGWADAGYHGSRIKTPTLDRLAAEGVRLERFYAYATCSPSRVGILLGRNPSRYDILGAIGQRSLQAIPKDAITLARAFKLRGYATAISGKWHLGLRPEVGPLQFGFDYTYGCLHGQIDPVGAKRYKNGDLTWHRMDQFIEEPGHVTDLIVDEAIRVIERWDDRPYFLYLPFNAPHGPFAGERAWSEPYENVFDEPSRRSYAGAVTHMDHGIGRVIEALERTGQRDRTLVVFLSDNGGVPEHEKSDNYEGRYGPYPELADNKPLRGWFSEVYDGSIRVISLANWPGVLEPRAVDEVTSVLDLYPTLIGLTGQSVDEAVGLEGRDIWEVLAGTGTAQAEGLYWKTAKQFAVLEGGWKLVIDRRGGETELYKMENDPYEKVNLAARYPDRVRHLREYLAQQRLLDPDRGKD